MYSRNADLKKTLKKPKVRVFSDVLEGKTEISLDNIFVEPAAKYMEKLKDTDVLASMDYGKVNGRLTEIYQDYLAQVKVPNGK